MAIEIEWRAETRELHLRTERISYVVRVLENGALGLLHVGAPLAAGRSYRHLVPREFHGFANRLNEPVALECPTPGIGDDRVPAIAVELDDGSSAIEPLYVGHRLLAGKPDLPGLPSTYVEAEDEARTVEVLLADARAGVEVTLRYTIFAGRAVVARSATIRNAGERPIRLRTAMSASLDLVDSAWRLIQLSGGWVRERHVVARPLEPGRTAVSSVRGASGHEHNPFVVLARDDTTEDHGEALGFSLVYSGSFLAEAEVDAFATTRLRLGINPATFSWRLAPGESFTTPEAIVAWTGDGLGDLSETYHRLFRERLARGPWRDRARPIVLNSWEGSAFDFDEDRLVEMASAGRDLGIELFVLDDGWFGQRDDDTSSLGDWVVDRRKLPHGIDGLARRMEALGLRFGLWIEPEMVSPRSRLFEAHPDWAIGVPGRPRTESRNQYVLDLSRPEVVEHLFGALSEVLSSGPISYVKWDMNRTLTESFSAALPPDGQAELQHRHVLGVYDLYRRLVGAFPDVLFESCAGGGGRFDPGLLAFAPQAWTSDNTDAIERLRIQWGTSLAYPLSSMAAHVSAVPNHQVGRLTPLATRAAVAFFGVFGYELDPRALSSAERDEVAAQVAFYAARRELFQRGRFVRLRNPFEGQGNETAWLVVSEDRRHAIVGHYQVLNRPMPGPNLLRLRGLDPAAVYEVSTWPPDDDGIARANRTPRGGDDLMAVGLFVESPVPREARQRGDFVARLFELVAR